ncbi:MAG: carboxylating nicotinate-nucleotide diphosphorylase [Nitrospiraceae bacterium]|nr:carboxylating nicotinate-nucleotide diphosphorylase [Nitrospiraceae bacterium]
MKIPYSVKEIIRIALDEDIGNGDITTSLLIPEDSESRALLIAKGQFVVAGMPFIKEVFLNLDNAIRIDVLINDGSTATKGAVITEITGKTKAILSGERVCLNILQRLCGIATLTNMFVEKIKGLDAKIVDTRKTTPGLRFMEKYAVRCGGGSNHRFGLFDGILIKDNHIEAVGSISKAVSIAKKMHHLGKIEVEVENLNDLKQAVDSDADIVMLDNMSLKDMKDAVRIVKASGKQILLEASGNVNLDNVRAIAETGVDLISIGALTHSAEAADISMKIVQ